VVDAVVDGEAVAEILEHRAARRARDQPEARDDQPLEEDLHQEDLLLEQVGLEEHVRELVEVRVALPLPADLADQPQPRLGVPRLVLHHRRVVEARLRVGRRREQLRRHLAREDVRLELLHDHRAPDIAPPRPALGRPLALRHERDLAPGNLVDLPLLVLREVVEAKDPCVLLAGLGLRANGLSGHGPDLILSGVIALVFSYEVRETAEFERVYGTDGEWAEFFRQGRGYIGTELLRDVEAPGRYLVIDRWESADAYNAFVAERREEYMARVDATRFHYDSELRFGTFETLL
jgi:heme-degrading monooxygenase HmoA